jgi:uncharacterized SAM-binding protein YcdF (DUF218 family)
MDMLFFIASKVIWGLLRPDAWIVIGAGLTCVALLSSWRRIGKWAASLTFVFVLLVAVVPVGDVLLRPLETRHPAAPELSQIDGIIVLGGSEQAGLSARWDQVVLNEGGERFIGAMALARQHPQARVVFTGGSGALGDAGRTSGSNAAVAERFFIEQGLDLARLTLEGASRNTAENAALSLALIKPKPEDVWVLVTSAFHMPRSVNSFHAAGWDNIVPWPVDYRAYSLRDGLGWNLGRNLEVLNTAVREYIGLLAYKATGR